MADEGSQVLVEHHSNAGKWLLLSLAVIAVAAFAYVQYETHAKINKVTDDLAASQAQVKELQDRMQTAEAQEETLARQSGMTKKDLVQKTAQLQAEQAQERGIGRDLLQIIDDELMIELVEA